MKVNKGPEISEREFVEIFDAFLDHCFKGWTFADISYQPSYLLRKVDPIRYHEHLAFYIESSVNDGFVIEHDGRFYHTKE